MQTNTQQRLSRLISFAVAAIVVIPMQLFGTPAQAADAGAPGVIPAVHYVGNGARSVSLSWDSPMADGAFPVSDYVIEYRQPGGMWSVFNDGTSTARSATVTGLTTGVDYEFRVAASNLAGQGPSTVMGGLSNFNYESTRRCGLDAVSQWWCVDYGATRMTYPVEDFYGVIPATTVSDIISWQGSCALSASRGVICGSLRNLYSELGRGFIGGHTGSFVVPGLPSDIVSVTSDNETNCALSAQHDLWCWGRWNTDPYAAPILVPTIVRHNVTQFTGMCANHVDNSVACLSKRSNEYRWIEQGAIDPLRTIDNWYDGKVCGISFTSTVVCFDPFIPGYASTVAGISDANSVIVGNNFSCVLRSSGTVTCWGDNSQGALGDGTRTHGRSDVRLPEPVTAIARDNGGSYFGAACATGISTTLYCWGNYHGPVIGGAQGPFYMPVAVSGVGTYKARGIDAPGKVTGLAKTGARATSLSISWSPVASSISIDGYTVAWRYKNSSTWTTSTVGTAQRAWTSPTLTPNSEIMVQVTAFNAAGSGPTSDALEVATTKAPERMTAPAVTGTTQTTATLSWSPAADRDEPITGYRFEWSTDLVTWHSEILAANVSQKIITGLTVGSAVAVRIAAINAAGTGAMSATTSAFIAGLAPRSIKVVDSWGQAVFGGQITWRRSDGSFESALDYGLTSDGRVTFPVVPSGTVQVSLRGVQVPGGALVDYDTSTDIGFTSDATIALPPEPSRSTHVIRVVLPNGMPVVGADVFATNLNGSATVSGATFTAGEVIDSGVTNEYGEVYLAGYSSEDSEVFAEYDDGILIQRQQEFLGEGDVTISLAEMPWIDTPVVTTEPTEGSLVTLTVRSNTVGAGMQRASLATTPATVSIEPPKGSPQKCVGKKLSATFAANGTATLKVCASKSGRYVLHGKGAIATGAVSLKVKGTPPVQVGNARAISPTHGAVTVSWSAPAYNGGNPVKNYTVTLKRGKKTITKTVTGTSVSITGLPGVTRWDVSVVATSKSGTSEPVRMLVPVS